MARIQFSVIMSECFQLFISLCSEYFSNILNQNVHLLQVMIPNRILNEVCFLHQIRLISSRIDAFAAFVAFVIETEIHSAGFDPGSETFDDILSHSVGYISYHTDHI